MCPHIYIRKHLKQKRKRNKGDRGWSNFIETLGTTIVQLGKGQKRYIPHPFQSFCEFRFWSIPKLYSCLAVECLSRT